MNENILSADIIVASKLHAHGLYDSPTYTDIPSQAWMIC